MNVLKTLFTTTNADFLQRPAGKAPLMVEVRRGCRDTEADQAMVTRTISPDELGRVKFQGTWWRAGSDRSLVLQAGTSVRVIGRQRSNILIVEPLEAVAQATADC